MKTTKKGLLSNYEEVHKDENAGLSKSLFKYLRHWKWFIASIVVCLTLGFLYLKMATPIYEVKAKILLNDDQKEGSTASTLNAFQDLGLFNVKNNTDNELEVLNTSYLMELVVRKLNIYTQYYEIGQYTNRELYQMDCPISVRLPENILDTLRSSVSFDVEVNPDESYVFSGTYENKDFAIRATKNDSMVALPFGAIIFAQGLYLPASSMKVGVTLDNPSRVADQLLSSMTIELASQTTTAVNLTLKTSNINKGKDIINTYIDTYKEEEVKDRALMARNTSDFLENFLGSLGNELSDAEKQVEYFKQREGVTDISSEAQLFIQRTGQYEQKRLEVGTQLGIVKDLESYINKSENRYQLLPSGVGIESTSLNSLIGEYNNLLLERKRLSRTATESNQVMIDLSDRIDALFKNVQSSVNNEKRNLFISQQDLNQKDRENAVRIKSIPRQEREISNLSRQQNIKSQLYLYLLQKRDENYLSTAAVAPKFKVLGYPRSNGVPVSPETDVILLVAFLGGFFLPFIGISIRDLMHFTIENREELKLISVVPILGEIPKSIQSGNVYIHENDTDGFTEMFRLLRTNLMFVLDEPWKKVINVVSSMNGEGKTSITINLAHSLALLDKKVLMIGLDIRKPKMDQVLGMDNKHGVTQYLSGHINFDELIRPSGIDPNLWVINAGPVPPNPNELLAKPALDTLINLYREQFDYILIDTPPISAVSDGLLLNRFADVNLYIIRADYTHKNDILDANDIFNSQKLNNMYFVLNAIDMHKASNRYGYRKSYVNGYGYYSQGKKHKKNVKIV